MQSELPAEFRDIELPEPIGWWPPAPGWWLMLALIVTSLIVLWFARRWWQNRLRRSAIRELDEIYTQHMQHGDDQQLVRQINILLRRFLLASGDKDAASLTGENWLQHLEQFCATTKMRHSEAQVLAEGPYQSNPKVDSERLVGTIQVWLSEFKTPQKL